jgi:hypothetical protein
MADRLRLLEGLLSVPVVAFWIFLPIALWKCRGEYNGDGLYRDRPRRRAPCAPSKTPIGRPGGLGDATKVAV